MKKISKVLSVLFALAAVFALLCTAAACSHDPVVQSISIDYSTVKTEFFVDEKFTCEGLKVTASYDNGETKDIPLADCTVTAPSMNTAGKKPVKVAYAGFEKTYTITVNKPHECSSACPVCGKCLDADCTDPACASKCTPQGTAYTFEAEDSHTSLIAGGISHPAPAKNRYVGGYDTNGCIGFAVNASANAVANLKVTVSQRDFVFTEKIYVTVNGERLERSPSVKGACEWETFHEVNLGCINLVQGKNLITFYNAGVGVNFDKIVLTSSAELSWYTGETFAINTDAVTKTFEKDGQFSYEGLTATLTDNGEPEDIALDSAYLEVRQPDLTEAGVKTVTVIYMNYYTATYEITVQVGFGDKTVNEFSATDGRVALTEGANGAISVMPDRLDNINNNYGATITLTVWTEEACTAQLWLNYGQRVLEMAFNDIFELKVNGETKVIEKDLPKNTDGTDWSVFVTVLIGDIDLVQGKNEICFKVQPEELSKGKGVNVRQFILATDGKEIIWNDSLSLDTQNVKKTFELGEEFTCEGLVVKSFSNGAETELGADDYTVIPADTFSAGEKTVTVTYNGISQTYTVTVNPETGEKHTYTFNAEHGSVALAGGARLENKGTPEAPDMWIDGINEVAGATVTYRIYAPESCFATLSAVINTMGNGKKFTDTMTFTVGGRRYTSDAVISFSQAAGWAAVEVPVQLCGLRLEQGENVIVFTKTAQSGYWFKGIKLESVASLDWMYKDLQLNTEGAKTEFVSGEDFTAEGLAVTCTAGGTETAVDAANYKVSAPDMITVGKKTVTVTYMGLSATYEITVTPAPDPVVDYTFAAYDGHATVGGDPGKELVVNTAVGYIDKINDYTNGTITFEIYSPSEKAATLGITINKMQKGKKFTDLMTVSLNGVNFESEQLITFDGENANWQANWITFTLGTLKLAQGKNTIVFKTTAACYANGFWFRGIQLSSTVALDWMYKDLQLNTDSIKKAFAFGEEFTAENLVVTCTEAGAEKTLEAGAYTLSTPDMLSSGEKTITVTYMGLSATYTITVAEDTAEKTAYSFDASNSTVTLAGGAVLNASNWVDGINEKAGATITFNIYSPSATVANLTIIVNTMSNGKKFTDTMTFTVGGKGYSSDAVISFTQAAGWAAVEVSVQLCGVRLEKGENVIVFTKTAVGGYWVKGIKLESSATLDWMYKDMVLNTESVKTDFAFGDEFTTENLVVICTEAGAQKTLEASEYAVSAPDMLTSGEKTVTVSYKGVIATYKITVAEEVGEKQTYTFLAHDGAVLSEGLVFVDKASTGNPSLWFVDKLEGPGVTGRTITYTLYSSAKGVATLTVLMNKHLKDKKFTDSMSVTVNGVVYDFDTLVKFDGNNAYWGTDVIEVTLGGIRLQQGENTIIFTKVQDDAGFYFHGIRLESTLTVSWQALESATALANYDLYCETGKNL